MFDTISWLLLAASGAGLLIFALAILLDGAFELGDFPILHALGVFLAGGAATALMARGFGLFDLITAMIVGAGVGVVLVLLLMKLLIAAKNSEHQGRVVDFSELVGSDASVVWWDNDHGDVLVNLSGQRLKVAAESEEPLAKDTPMEIAGFERDEDILVKVLVKARN